MGLLARGSTFQGNVVVQGALHTKGGGLALPTAAAAPAACDQTRAGEIYFNSKWRRFYGCDGQGWVRLQSSITGLDLMSKSLKFWVDSNTGGSPANTADRLSRTVTGGWPSYCVQTNGSGATHWLKVDLGEPHYIEQFGISGYPGGSHKPTGTWRLEGSTDNSKWITLWAGKASLWTNGGRSYPPQQTITLTHPGSYRYYRVIGKGWTNGYMLVCNWALYE